MGYNSPSFERELELTELTNKLNSLTFSFTFTIGAFKPFLIRLFYILFLVG